MPLPGFPHTILTENALPGTVSIDYNSSIPIMSNPPPYNNPYEISYKFNGSMAIIVVVVVSAFLFMGFFLFYIRNRWSFERRIITSFRQQEQATPGAAAGAGQPNPNGLDRTIVEKFPLMRYASSKAANVGRSGSLDCSVCLTEFQEEEKLRILPKCGHGFHADCIDMWLLSHSTCPLCRISLVPSAPDQIGTASASPLTDAALPEEPGPAPSDAPDGDPVNITIEMGDRKRLMEMVAVQALSRNSESFRKAAQDAELLPSTPGEEDGSTSSGRRKSMRKSRSMERYQRSSTSSIGERDDPHLRVSSEMGTEIVVGGKIQRHGSFSSASETWGSARSTGTDLGRLSMATSDILLGNEVGQQQARRNEDREWVSIDLDAATEPFTSSHISQYSQITHRIYDPAEVSSPKETHELKLEVFEGKYTSKR
ncbi:hypothetical protein O6H91_17G076100 [Diphasiastrum complanatum]|uniref:Uncharacterized protein n=1 Tax=Diphasiastrum complanatum TaxID=34168 RepID=A0ACC2B869_DIPCM|nr:hypothetical protein O6H91_17G076100 [Diphasiastrum complanatum]